MTEAIERDIILEHALENATNLELALDIAAAYPDLRRRVIVAFLEKLDRFVRKHLDESQWVLNSPLHTNPFEKYAGFFVSKKAWAERYRVALSAESLDGKGFIIGVQKHVTTLPSIEDLKKALDTQIRQGSESEWWYWYHKLEHPYRDWDTKEALINMYNGTAVDDLGKYLLRIKTLVEPIIDKHISGMSA